MAEKTRELAATYRYYEVADKLKFYEAVNEPGGGYDFTPPQQEPFRARFAHLFNLFLKVFDASKQKVRKGENGILTIDLPGALAYHPSLVYIMKDILEDSLARGLGEKELREKLAIFRYFSSFAHFYVRGSASVTEWIESAICQSNGYDCVYRNFVEDIGGPLPDLDAFYGNIFLSDFLHDYSSKLQVTPRSESPVLPTIPCELEGKIRGFLTG